MGTVFGKDYSGRLDRTHLRIEYLVIIKKVGLLGRRHVAPASVGKMLTS